MAGVSRIAPLFVLAVLGVGGTAAAQGTTADYQRAMGLREAWQTLAVGVPETPAWVGRSNRFWFRRSARGGNEFVLVDPDTRTIGPAFDHARLAAALSTAAHASYRATTLPFTSFTFVEN